MDILVGVGFVLAVLFFVGYFVARIVSLTDKMEKEKTLRHALKVLIKEMNGVDWIFMPAYLVMALSLLVLFSGIALAEKNEEAK
jgi:hypothetical protein